MSQPPEGHAERRSEPRRPAAFAFRFSRAGTQHSAWMLNLSTRGAAFLVAATDTPCVGERLEFMEMYSADRSVREAAETLPARARVVRVDDPDAATRCVAVRFDLAVSGPLVGDSGDDARSWQPLPRTVTAVAPLPLIPPDQSGAAQAWPAASLPVHRGEPLA